MLKSIFLLWTLIATIQTVNAETLLYYTPKGGQSAIQTEYEWTPNTILENKENESKITYSGNLLKLNYQYGLNDYVALGAELGLGEQTLSTSTTTLKDSGLKDSILKLHAKYNLFLLGMDISLPNSKAITHTYSDKAYNGNLSSGGITISPYVGMLYEVEDFNLGVVGAYDHRLERQSEYADHSGSNTTTGGHQLQLSPFIEWNYGSGFIAAQLTKSSVSEISSKNQDNFESTQQKFEYHKVALKGSYNFSNQLTMLMDITQQSIPKQEHTSAYSLNFVSLGLRMVF